MAHVADTISGALCGVMEQALIEKGIEPTLARALAERACQPALEAAPAAAAKAARKVSKVARRSRSKMKEALAQANRELRTKSGALRKGVTQRDVMVRAHKIRKKM